MKRDQQDIAISHQASRQRYELTLRQSIERHPQYQDLLQDAPP